MSSIQDPLLGALLAAMRLHGKTGSAEQAVSGLPLKDGKLTPDTLVRAAGRCGFEASVIKRPIRKLNADTFPALLFLKQGRCAVVERVTEGGDYAIRLFAPGAEEEQIVLGARELKKHYLGVAVLLKPAFEYEDRAKVDLPSDRGHWFWGTLWRFRTFYFQVAVATVVVNLLALTSSIFIMNVYDRVVPNKAIDTLMALGIGAIIAFVFEFNLKMLRSFMVDRAGRRIDLILGSRLFERILGMKFRHAPESAGATASQARAFESLRDFFSSASIAALVDLPFVFLFAGIVYLLGGAVAAPLLLGICISLSLNLLLQIPIKRNVARSFQAGNQRYALFVEGIQALETVKTTRSESGMQTRMEDTVRRSALEDSKSRFYSQLALNGMSLIQHLITVSVVWVAFYQVTAEAMSMGAMIACVLLSGRAMAPLSMVASLLSRYQMSRRSLDALDHLMNLPVEREPGRRKIALSTFEPGIQIQDLAFGFSEDGNDVFDHLNLTIKPGEKVAVLGKIGSGKSTLLRLLMGLYEPVRGNIAVSGIETRQLDPAVLRRNIGYVCQDSTLLYGTLRSNLTAGCPHIDDDALWKAIRRAGLESYIRSLPEGLDTKIAEGGKSLSGGQRQSVHFARAILEEPAMLVLDEPSSAMDPGTEKNLISQLAAYFAGHPDRTLVLATHKKNVAALADRIIVLDKGKVLAEGPTSKMLKNAPHNGRPNPATPRPQEQEEDVILSPESIPDYSD